MFVQRDGRVTTAATDEAKMDHNTMTINTQDWAYIVHTKDGQVRMYSEHEDVAEWIKEDIDAGNTVARIRAVTTQNA